MPNNGDGLIPPLTQPTASFVLKETLGNSELATILADITGERRAGGAEQVERGARSSGDAATLPLAVLQRDRPRRPGRAAVAQRR